MWLKLLGTPWVVLKGITSKTGKAIPGRTEAAAGLSILLAETGIEAMVAIGELDYFYNVLNHFTPLENFARFRPEGAVSRALSCVTRELFCYEMPCHEHHIWRAGRKWFNIVKQICCYLQDEECPAV